MRILPILTLLLLPTMGLRAEEAIDDSTPAKAKAALTDPKKLATLKGERASNPRLQKCLYWLATARAKGESPAYVMASANLKNGQQITPYGALLASSLTANLAEADKLGLFSPEGLDELRRGNSATITKGDNAGQEATADHFIPRAVCLELDNQIFNLRLLPSKLNSSKSDKVEKEQVEYAEELHRNGLLSQGGLDAVQTAYKKGIVLTPTPAPLTQEERDKVEQNNQVAMGEESRRLAIEDVRAEQKGWHAVYFLRKERTEKQAEKANKTKASSDVLIFEQMVSNTLEAYHNAYLSGKGYKDYEISRANGDERERLGRLLDAALRAE